MQNKARNILIGITGGIAAYKICDLIRLFVKSGNTVDVIMTDHAKEFITPLTVQTLTGNPVYSDLFTLISESRIGHISLADKADVVVIAPATANVIGKMAHGIADDLLTTTVMATKAPVVIVPSMNSNMWENPVVSDNIKTIRRYYTVMHPAQGMLACGVYGSGRLPDVEDIYEQVMITVSVKPLKGKKVLVTAGPTIEELDPVRYLSNYSSGKMGYAIARQARRLGGDVTLISGPVIQREPFGVRTIKVRTADEMCSSCVDETKKTDVLIMAAAVADYRPVKNEHQKIKKEGKTISLSLTQNPDILATLAKHKKKRTFFVGFAAETGDLVRNARKKLASKKLDMIVANNVLEKGAGFSVDTNKVTVIDAKETISLPLMSKDDVAAEILVRIIKKIS